MVLGVTLEKVEQLFKGKDQVVQTKFLTMILKKQLLKEDNTLSSEEMQKWITKK